MVEDLENLENKVKNVIDEKIRPLLQLHGGECEFIEVRKNVVKVRLTGACAICPGAKITLQTIVKEIITSNIPEIEEVLAE